MCRICTKDYNNETKVIVCCDKVSKIPYIPILRELYCGCSPFIKEIPYLPNLVSLNCTRTNVTKIPFFPKLYYLYCSYTKITELPSLTNGGVISYHSCDWLECSYPDKKDFQKQLGKLILLQRLWKSRQWNKIKENIPLIPDIKENCIRYYL
jgi:Leucine-rich repeat (LRR) protein